MSRHAGAARERTLDERLAEDQDRVIRQLRGRLVAPPNPTLRVPPIQSHLALRNADRLEEVAGDGEADDDEWAPLELPDEIATAEAGKDKDKSDIPFPRGRGTTAK